MKYYFADTAAYMYLDDKKVTYYVWFHMTLDFWELKLARKRAVPKSAIARKRVILKRSLLMSAMSMVALKRVVISVFIYMY